LSRIEEAAAAFQHLLSRQAHHVPNHRRLATQQAGRQIWRTNPMKTMTCRQLGGPCDLPLSGDSGDEIIKAQDRHLKEIVASEDTEHQSALQDMKGRSKNPIAGMGWYRQVKRDFKALP